MKLDIRTVETATREELLADSFDHVRTKKFSRQKESATFELLRRYDTEELRGITKIFIEQSQRRKKNVDGR